LSEALRDHGPVSVEAALASTVLNDDLLERSRQAARSGAEIVIWSETAALLLKRDEDAFLARAATVARQEGIYLFAAYGAADSERVQQLENRLAALTPAGDVAWIYDKAHPIAGSESNFVAQGRRTMRTLDTPFGRIGATICHDADFPHFVRQAPSLGVDVLINPADDWAAIQSLHANMAAYRAVETGVTMLRAARGISFAAGPPGNMIATRNSIAGEGRDFIARVPVRTVATIPLGSSVVLAIAALLLGALSVAALNRREEREV
jgi:apolipoprotein N-acyltransferase